MSLLLEVILTLLFIFFGTILLYHLSKQEKL